MKNCNREDLKSAILHVAKGGTWFTGPMAVRGSMDKANYDQGDLSRQLTPVQKEIVDLLINGFHHREIAKKLNTTPAKIEKTLTGLRNNFQCKTTIELVLLLSGKSAH
jgi:DNA-binding NarL/FixJ family response regulator